MINHKWYNTNFKGFINHFRIRHAKMLIESRLASSEKYDLADIFSQCGFSTNESFYRIFKSITGTTPGKYEKHHKNQINSIGKNNFIIKNKNFYKKKKDEQILIG